MDDADGLDARLRWVLVSYTKSYYDCFIFTDVFKQQIKKIYIKQYGGLEPLNPLIRSWTGHKNLVVLTEWPYWRSSLNKKIADWAFAWGHTKRGRKAGFYCHSILILVI